jgi:hypothetical protein
VGTPSFSPRTTRRAATSRVRTASKARAPLAVPRRDLVDRDAAARVDGLVLAGVDELREEAASRALQVVREAVDQRVGVLLERADQAAEVLVHLGREGAAAASLPQAAEGVLQERQGAGLVADVGEDPVEQTWREGQADERGRGLDRAAHLLAGHASDEDPVFLVVGDAVEAEAGVVDEDLAAVAEEVDAEGEDDVHAGVGAREGPQLLHEGLAGLRVGDVREELLELVDDEQQRTVRATGEELLQHGDRRRPGGHLQDLPRARATGREAGDLGDDARQHHRRLAGARGADDDEEAGLVGVDQGLEVAEGLVALGLAARRRTGGAGRRR